MPLLYGVGGKMQVIITYTKKEYEQLKVDLIEQIINDSKQGWGCRFVARDTNEEIPDDAMRGQLVVSINTQMRAV